ncbi:MAG: hypothetical protein K6B74_06790 [Ruminococcus sp.]|nr:hypothetical protein [Ruminococcus sp.]
MINSLRLIVYELKRSTRIAIPLITILLTAEMLFFFALSVVGSKKMLMPGGVIYTLLPGMFYMIALIVPLVFFLKTTVGKDTLLIRSLPVYPDTPLSAMMICSIIWSIAAEIFRMTVCAFALIMTASVTGISRREMILLLFSVYGMSGYVMTTTRNILVIVCLQLFISMITLLASMSHRHRKLLAMIYGMTGGAIILFASVFLMSEGVEDSATEATFFHYLPQIICLLCFITFFGIVSAFIMKHRHEVC